MKTHNLRQLTYLFIISVLGLMVLSEISVAFSLGDWVFPREFGHAFLVRGIVSDLAIALLLTAFLVLLAWLPGQLRGGIVTTLMLGSAVLLFELALLIGTVSNVISGDLQRPALLLGYGVREFVIIGLLPVVLIEMFRRRTNKRHLVS